MAAALALTVGIAALAGGCAGSPGGAAGSASSEVARASDTPPLPALDLNPPATFETASFGFG